MLFAADWPGKKDKKFIWTLDQNLSLRENNLI